MIANDEMFLPSVESDDVDQLAEESASKVVPYCSDGESSISAEPASTSTDDIESSTGNSNQASSTLEFERDLKRKILQEEERNVRRAKILAGVAFIACAAAVTCGVYFSTIQSDQYAFEAEVSNDDKNPS